MEVKGNLKKKKTIKYVKNYTFLFPNKNLI